MKSQTTKAPAAWGFQVLFFSAPNEARQEGQTLTPSCSKRFSCFSRNPLATFVMNLKMRREDLVVNVTEMGNSQEPERVWVRQTL